MARRNDALAQAERLVRDAERRIARQLAIIEELERECPRAAAIARKMLPMLWQSLELARAQQRRERVARGLEPEPPSARTRAG